MTSRTLIKTHEASGNDVQPWMPAVLSAATALATIAVMVSFIGFGQA